MLKFDDKDTWFDERVRGVKKAYKVTSDIKGVAVDVGANVGAFSYVNHNKFNKIIAIEPAQETFDKCVNNTSKFKNVSVYKYAVSNKSGETIRLYPFNEGGNVSGNATTVKNDITAKHYNFDVYEEIETISLKDIYTKFEIDKINYLKIDCEGNEYDFLIGEDLQGIDYIAIEIHLHLGPNKIKELKDLIDKTHVAISSFGNGVNSHFEITYKNKNLID
tara:strand:+ start:12744 stop:13400 length:657 start_codon:yes stop_codon:yes gene_type:complete